MIVLEQNKNTRFKRHRIAIGAIYDPSYTGTKKTPHGHQIASNPHEQNVNEIILGNYIARHTYIKVIKDYYT